MKTLIKYLAKRLVETPEQAEVNEVIGRTLDVYELRVGDGDLGKIIGRQGRNIRALRIVTIASATRDGRRVTLEILE